VRSLACVKFDDRVTMETTELSADFRYGNGTAVIFRGGALVIMHTIGRIRSGAAHPCRQHAHRQTAGS